MSLTELVNNSSYYCHTIRSPDEGTVL